MKNFASIAFMVFGGVLAVYLCCMVDSLNGRITHLETDRNIRTIESMECECDKNSMLNCKNRWQAISPNGHTDVMDKIFREECEKRK